MLFVISKNMIKEENKQNIKYFLLKKIFLNLNTIYMLKNKKKNLKSDLME